MVKNNILPMLAGVAIGTVVAGTFAIIATTETYITFTRKREYSAAEGRLPFGIEPLTPAYGRVYKTIEQAQDAFDGGSDFHTARGPYISKPEIIDLFPYVRQIRVRFGDGLKHTNMININAESLL